MNIPMHKYSLSGGNKCYIWKKGKKETLESDTSSMDG